MPWWLQDNCTFTHPEECVVNIPRLKNDLSEEKVEKKSPFNLERLYEVAKPQSDDEKEEELTPFETELLMMVHFNIAPKVGWKKYIKHSSPLLLGLAQQELIKKLSS